MGGFNWGLEPRSYLYHHTLHLQSSYFSRFFQVFGIPLSALHAAPTVEEFCPGRRRCGAYFGIKLPPADIPTLPA